MKYVTHSIERPYRFTGEMLRGAFQDITHHHEFVPHAHGTLMIDHFAFHVPPGLLGKLAETLFLTRYMKKLLLTRNTYPKQVAESARLLKKPSLGSTIDRHACHRVLKLIEHISSSL